MLAPAKDHPAVAKASALERLCRCRAVALGDIAPSSSGGGGSGRRVGLLLMLVLVLAMLELGERVCRVDIVLDIVEINGGVVHGHGYSLARAGQGWRGTGRGVDE